ncbi:MAG: M56 family metallopeptidase [Terriglobales bacterium]
MLSAVHFQAIADASATGILVYIAGGIPIALLAWALMRVWEPQGSGTRFAVWYSALFAIVLLPAMERVRSGQVSSSAGASHSLITLPGYWAITAFALWAVLAALALLRVAIGLAKLRRLRRNCRSIEPSTLHPALQDALQELRSWREVKLCVSDDLSVPTAIGFFRPLVILPAWALQDLSVSELRPVLLHELAHVKRWDDWTNLVQKLIQAVLFFHPAVWWIERRISLEREMSCDDIALRHTGNARAYAECLLAVAERSFAKRGFSLAQAAVTRMRQTSARIAKILAGAQRRQAGLWQPASLLLAASFSLSFVVLPRLPELISFREEAVAPPMTASLNIPAKEDFTRFAGTKTFSSRAANATHLASLKSSRPISPARRRGADLQSRNVIPARFQAYDNGRYVLPLQSKNAAAGRRALFTQTLFVVTRSQRDPQSPGFWTIRVWRLTVFEAATAIPNLHANKV